MVCDLVFKQHVKLKKLSFNLFNPLSKFILKKSHFLNIIQISLVCAKSIFLFYYKYFVWSLEVKKCKCHFCCVLLCLIINLIIVLFSFIFIWFELFFVFEKIYVLIFCIIFDHSHKKRKSTVTVKKPFKNVKLYDNLVWTFKRNPQKSFEFF